jgi:uncharacterized damage-inducible protein DinB
MNELERISQQMKQALSGEAWHGPCLEQILEGVNAKMAAARPIAQAHSIWEIVLHLISVQNLVLSRLQGQEVEVTPETDFPAIIELSEEAWQETLQQLRAGEHALRNAVLTFSEELLDEPIIAQRTSAYNNFHGLVQHSLYHAGQMILLKKMLLASNS